MGSEPGGGAAMNRLCWRLVDMVSRALQPDERDAVRGDFAESGETAGQALRDVLGLVVRRQAALWKGWRPWLAFVGLVVPFGMLLCLVSRRMADWSAIYAWLYANNWDWTLLRNAAFRHDFPHHIALIFIAYAALFCWSWSSGLVIGSVSRNSIPMNGVLFGLMLFFGELLGAPPRYLEHAFFYQARDFSSNAAVFDLTFYRVMFPLIVQGVLVLIPSVWGMRWSLQVAKFRPLLRTIIWTAAIAALAAIAIQNWGFVAIPRIQQGIRNGWQIRLIQLVVYWPIGYLAVSAIGRRWPTVFMKEKNV
jgi:hypothetical protein